MIIENKTTEQGDILRISTDVPILGLVLLRGFLDSTTGETGDLYYKKMFRYSKDIGASWSDWVELNSMNLQNVPVKEKESFLFEYAYRQEGRDGDLYFNWVQLEGEISQGNNDIYEQTDFKNFFDVNDIHVLGWAFNVLEKLYELGILPRYVKRDYTPDSKDFIDYWLTVTHFFALIVYMARQFEDIPANATLFNMFIEEKGLAFSGNETQVQRDYLFANYINEFRKRGTKNITDDEGVVNGEFLRLINYKTVDEFLFFNLVRQDLGWCCDVSSPMWTGTEQIVNAMKAYEYPPSVENVLAYPLIGDFSDENIVDLNGYKWLELPQTPGTVNGVSISDGKLLLQNGYPVLLEKRGSLLLENSTLSLKNQLLKISPAISYEIYFRVISTSTDATANDNLSFGVKGYTGSLDEVDFVNARTDTIQNSFFDLATPRVLYKVGVEYWMRGVILAADEPLRESASLNFRNGVPLKANKNVRYFTPIVTQAFEEGCKTLLIRDIKVKPLNLSVERGFFESILPVVTYFYNNSGKDNSYVKNFTERYLIGYKNNILLPTYLSDVTVTLFKLSTEWVPLAGGNVTGAGDYKEGDIATVNITPSVGYQIDSITINGESRPVSSKYLVSMTKDTNILVVFRGALMNFVTTNRFFSFNGTKYDGDFIVDWGDGITTTNILTHRYSDTASTHIVTVNKGNVTKLKAPDNGITSVNFLDASGINSIDLDGNSLSSINLSSLAEVTSVSMAGNKLSTISLTGNPDILCLDLSDNELVEVNVMNLSKLETLYLGSNKLSSLNVSNNTSIKVVHVDNNELTVLNIGRATSLTDLSAYGNRLTSFYAPAGNGIASLNIGANDIPAVDLSTSNYSKLMTLKIDNMPVMTALTVSNLPVLSSLSAKGNGSVLNIEITNNPSLPGIDLSGCAYVEEIDCSMNRKLSSLNVSGDVRLSRLTANDSSIEEIDLSTNGALDTVWMDNNKLTRFSAPLASSLKRLSLSGNELTSIDLTRNTLLKVLDVSSNNLVFIDLTKQTVMETIVCSSNLLTDDSIPGILASERITEIKAASNNFTSFSVSGKKDLRDIDLSNCVVLKDITANNNESLVSLNLASNIALETLNGANNALETVSITSASSLRDVDLGNNQITSLEYDGCESVSRLVLSRNLLSTFNPDKIGSSLETLLIDQNSLMSLSFGNTIRLSTLNCNNNQLASLTFSPSFSRFSTIDGVVNALSVSPQIAYSFNGNVNPLNRATSAFVAFSDTPAFADGVEKGVDALLMNGYAAKFPSTMIASDSINKVSGSFMLYPSEFVDKGGLCGGSINDDEGDKLGWGLGWDSDIEEGKLILRIYNDTESAVLVSERLSVNEWHHVAFRVRYDDQTDSWTMELYIDGTKYMLTTTMNGGRFIDFSGLNTESRGNGMYFGAMNIGEWVYFNGLIQDVIITDDYLSDNDIDLLVMYYEQKTNARFARLSTLDCSNNRLTRLDLTKADYVIDLNCSRNLIGQGSAAGQPSILFGDTLPANKIINLNASHNMMKVIDLTRNTNLVNITLNDNEPLETVKSGTSTGDMKSVKTFVAFNTALKTLNGPAFNSLRKLDLHDCASFVAFDPDNVHNDQMEYLDLSNCVKFNSQSFENINEYLFTPSIKELYLRGMTQINLDLDVSRSSSLIKLDASGSAFTSIKTEDDNIQSRAANLEWWSAKGCENVSRIELRGLINLKYLDFGDSGAASIDFSSSDVTVYEEIHVEHTPIVKNSTAINYSLFLLSLNTTTAGKIYTSNDDVWIKQEAVKQAVEGKGWKIIFVD